MTNMERIINFLDNAKSYVFLDFSGHLPMHKSLGFHFSVGDKLYLGCEASDLLDGEILISPRIIIGAAGDDAFLRYWGDVKIVKEESLYEKARESYPKLMNEYNKFGTEFVLFYLENAHAQIMVMHEVHEEFDV